MASSAGKTTMNVLFTSWYIGCGILLLVMEQSASRFSSMEECKDLESVLRVSGNAFGPRTLGKQLLQFGGI